MILLVSPTKTMHETAEGPALSQPVFLRQARKLAGVLEQMTADRQKALWKCSDAIAARNAARLKSIDWEAEGMPAVRLYDGLQFRHIREATLTESSRIYLGDHLRILSGLYGVLRPYDGIWPYRLDMEARLSAAGKKNLYEFWGRQIYEAVCGDGAILNLSSKEYSRCVLPYVEPSVRYAEVSFLTKKAGKLTQQSTYAKIGRGELVRYMAEHKITRLPEIRAFSAAGFHWEETLSDEEHVVFVRSGET